MVLFAMLSPIHEPSLWALVVNSLSKISGRISASYTNAFTVQFKAYINPTLISTIFIIQDELHNDIPRIGKEDEKNLGKLVLHSMDSGFSSWKAEGAEFVSLRRFLVVYSKGALLTL
ncbi:hypothetical protein [Limisalsivibrio acetivorans]|uniref:hypothetical protein n=1 Tax=Limisalsivibrio acetivorans TaxID=1304888 RepID=UPI0003B3EE9A|nr:hypothetical protein [Limisalsivibrio acetivorans]